MSKKYQPIGIGMTPSTTELGSFVRDCRLKLGLRQSQLAEQMGRSQDFISNLEIGRKKSLSEHDLNKLAEIFQCSPDELRNKISKNLGWYTKVPPTEVGRLVRMHRERLGMTMGDLAKKMGLPSYNHVYNLEVSNSISICRKTAESLANALNLDFSVFEKFVKEEKPMSSKLGELIRTRRKELRMTLEQLARKLNVKRQFVSQIEFGISSLCESDDIIFRLAEILQYDANELLTARSKRKLKPVIAITPLGTFLRDARINLNLTQGKVSNRSGVTPSIVSLIERGARSPSCFMLEKISKALACKIPAELIPPPKQRKPRIDKGEQRFPMTFYLSDQSLVDLKKIKEVSDIHGRSEVLREALSLLRRQLEKIQ